MSSNCISSTLEIPGGRQQASGRGNRYINFRSTPSGRVDGYGKVAPAWMSATHIRQRSKKTKDIEQEGGIDDRLQPSAAGRLPFFCHVRG